MLADAFAHDSLSFNQTAQYDLAILSNIILIDDEDILLENVATGLAMPLPVMSKAELWMGSAMTKLTRIFNATIGFFLAAKAQTEP